LSYSGLTGDVQQAHIHVGQKSVTGMLQSANMISGTIINQGIAPGEFNELLRAIRAGVAYVNVHSSTFPAGEFRGQLRLHED
jgi:hypothetical protein